MIHSVAELQNNYNNEKAQEEQLERKRKGSRRTIRKKEVCVANCFIGYYKINAQASNHKTETI